MRGRGLSSHIRLCSLKRAAVIATSLNVNVFLAPLHQRETLQNIRLIDNLNHPSPPRLQRPICHLRDNVKGELAKTAVQVKHRVLNVLR